MTNVLIASVGESPAVITSMYEALHKHPDGPHVKIDKVILIYPDYDSGKHINAGIDCIEDYLRNKCSIELIGLPFEDVYSKEHSIEYLRTISQAIFNNRYNDVHLSIAGGRKNMSALTTVVTQFYSCIRGVYHVVDRCESKPSERHFLTIEELINKTKDEREKYMKPVLADIALINIPFTTLADSDDWMAYLGKITKGKQANIPVEGEAAIFFSDVFGSTGESEILDVQLSATAIKDFADLGADDQGKFISHMNTLSRADYVSKYGREAYKCGFKTDCIVFPPEKTRDNLRIFFTWDKSSNNIIVHRIFLHDEYVRKIKTCSIMKENYPPKTPINELLVKNGTLMVTVGLSPMVVTQLFVLLRNERVNINRIAFIYPEENGDICNGIRLLRNIFQNNKITREVIGQNDSVVIKEYPVPIKDLDSQDTCRAFAEKLRYAIKHEKNECPHTPIYLSISGGRKAMAAYAYYAAQHNGLTEVYHTVISDPDLEKKIEKETNLDKMEAKGWDLKTKAEYLFLQRYSGRQDAFHLIAIPVIPVI